MNIYADELKRMGLVKVPKDIVAQATLFAKLRDRKMSTAAKKNGEGSAYKKRGLQVRTWGNRGEGY